MGNFVLSPTHYWTETIAKEYIGMIYYMKRVLIVAFLMLFIVGIVKRKGIQIRRKALIFLLPLAAYAILAYLPFENMYMTFSSPEEAYLYTNPKQLNVICKIDGEESTLLVSRKEGEDNYILVPKTDAGWKIGLGFEIRNVSERIQNGTMIKIIQYRSHDDYYVIVFDLNDSVHTISDQIGSSFFELQRDTSVLPTKTYIAHIVDIQPDYCVEVNGTEYIAIQTEK